MLSELARDAIENLLRVDLVCIAVNRFHRRGERIVLIAGELDKLAALVLNCRARLPIFHHCKVTLKKHGRIDRRSHRLLQPFRPRIERGSVQNIGREI